MDKKVSAKEVVKKIGFPTIIIAAFLIFILILGYFMGLSVSTLLSDTCLLYTSPSPRDS